MIHSQTEEVTEVHCLNVSISFKKWMRSEWVFHTDVVLYKFLIPAARILLNAVEVSGWRTKFFLVYEVSRLMLHLNTL